MWSKLCAVAHYFLRILSYGKLNNQQLAIPQDATYPSMGYPRYIPKHVYEGYLSKDIVPCSRCNPNPNPTYF